MTIEGHKSPKLKGDSHMTTTIKNLCTIIALGNFIEEMDVLNAMYENGYRKVNHCLVKTYDMVLFKVDIALSRIYEDENGIAWVDYVTTTTYGDGQVCEARITEPLKAILK